MWSKYRKNVQPGYAFVLYTNNETVLLGEHDTGSLLTVGRGWIQATQVPSKNPFSAEFLGFSSSCHSYFLWYKRILKWGFVPGCPIP